MKKILVTTTLFLLASSVTFASDKNDWRKTASDKEKLENVVKVMPGASNLMLQMGERYRNLYWAGKQKKWEFAEYQIEEMEDLIETLIITRPKRAATAKKFLSAAFEPIENAIEKKDIKAFRSGFETLRAHCMTCHRDNDHAFITLNPKPRKGNSPVLD